MARLLISFIFLFISLEGLTQEYNPERLREIAEEQRVLQLERQEKVKRLAGPMGYPMEFELNDGRVAVLVDIRDGMPYYYAVMNEQARNTTGVEYVQSASGLNLPLLGDGITIAVFDGGTVRGSHVELTQKVQNIITSQELDNHATHVTGTIAARGINPAARGMLPNAKIRAYYALNGNDLGPIADEAADGLILSNHSYGVLAGWENQNGSWGWYGGNNQRDPKFGSYNNKSRSLDNITYNAPKYMIVWAAGNDRSDVGDGSKPPDGPYDCIVPEASAKNILTIGAITGFDTYNSPDDAKMTGFSSWGPTDDGRIKPDLVGDGSNVLSTGSEGDDNYVSLNGTSMASPNVTGTLGMVQQYFKQLKGDFMNSATLKALAIHTAREAGSSAGPDYKNGWGVMNGQGAVELLTGLNDTDTLVLEETLGNSATKVYEIFSDGKTPVTATIAWTDVPGVVGTEGETTPKLINDLDIVLLDDENNEIRPWILDPEQPGRSARRGDNFRDNVEKIELLMPEPRNYRLVVSHKGTLTNGSQKFGLVITGNALINEGSELYWIANSGSAFNASNWSSSSGGNGLSSLEVNGKTLVFDNNSAITNGGIVTFNQSAELENLIYLSDQPGIIDLGGNTLTVDDLVFSTNEELIIRNGTLVIRSSNQAILEFKFNGENLNVILDNLNNLEISGPVSISDLTVSAESNVRVVSQEMNLDNLTVNGNLTCQDCNVSLSGTFAVNGSIDDTESAWSFNGSVLTSNKVINLSQVNSQGITSMSGDWQADSWINSGTLTLLGQLVTNSFSLLNSGLVLEENGHLIVNTELLIAGSAGALSSITGTTSASEIEIGYRDLLCYDFTEVENIDFNTESVINFGENSSLSNVNNAENLNCDDVVFASFEFLGNCANSIINISNLARGSISNYQYDLGDGTESQVENPIVVYDETGEYLITQTVSNDLVSESFSFILNAQPNELAPIEIIETEQGLVANLVSSEYQWYRNNILIEGATGRTFVPELNGDYRVAYFNNSSACGSRVSPAYRAIVTSIDDELPGPSTRAGIYPNPVSQLLYVNDVKYQSEVMVYAISGKFMAVPMRQVQDRFELDVHALPSGLYVLKVLGDKQNLTFKFFKK